MGTAMVMVLETATAMVGALPNHPAFISATYRLVPGDGVKTLRLEE
jgi:hypothetical protein